VRSGALLGGMMPPQLERLNQFGRRVGHAFQYVDDLLDWGSDGKANIKSKSDLKGSIKGATDQALSALEAFGSDAGHLRDLAKFLAERSL